MSAHSPGATGHGRSKSRQTWSQPAVTSPQALDSRMRVDISARSIEVARQRAPGVEFVACDMTRVEFPADSFDLVTAFYSILHVPADEQPGLVARVASWLVPG